MNDLVRLSFGVVLLLFALSFAFAYLSGPMSLLRKAGVLKVLRWAIKALWRALAFVFQLVTRTRKLPIRRPGTRNTVRRAG